MAHLLLNSCFAPISGGGRNRIPLKIRFDGLSLKHASLSLREAGGTLGVVIESLQVLWSHTVDGSEILHLLRLVVYPIIYNVL